MSSVATVPAAATVDLSNCDREPIRIPGSIQAHGCLIACDTRAATILRHSANARAVLGFAPLDLNGRTLDEVVGLQAAHDIRNALLASPARRRPQLMLGVTLDGPREGAADEAPRGEQDEAAGPRQRQFDIAASHCPGGVIIEFEATPPGVPMPPLMLARQLIAQLGDHVSVEALTRRAAQLIRGLVGYDRVMVYRFTHDGSGQVVSESKRGGLESFLGQFFPATDIPKQARELYLQNVIRVVADAAAEPIPVDPVLDASGEPLDLSLAHLRSVSPIHCEYLRNMGVAASMSVSIIIDGALWGLIACHHYKPFALGMAQRTVMEMFGEFFALHIDGLERRIMLDSANRARRLLDGFLRHAASTERLVDAFLEGIEQFRALMPCDGVGLWLDDGWTADGHVPPKSAIPGLTRFVASVARGRIWATHALSQQVPVAEAFRAEVSGMLVVPLSQRPRDYLFFFRREVLQTVEWGGDPAKRYTTGPHGERLTPRGSFAIWKETVERQSLPWTPVDREIAETARVSLVELIVRRNELIADERQKSDVRQRMLNEELNHRVKNILALIESLVAHPIDAGRTLAEYAETLRGRIRALAFAHDQVVRGAGGGRLDQLLEAEFSPYRAQGVTMELAGPTVMLDSRAYSVMALVLHELTTNAAKYGALSRPGGRLAVEWTVVDGGGCEIAWRESGGPKVRPPWRTGFGTVLIDRSIPHDLEGTSRVDYLPAGVEAHFFVPAQHVDLVAREPAAPPAPPSAPATARRGLADLGVLIVEDQLLIAMSVEAMLTEGGARQVETSNSATEAFRLLAGFTPDVAVLDVNLGTGTSVPVALELVARGVPIVFATGYGEIASVPPELARAPVIRKPYDRPTLELAIEMAMTEAKPRP